MRRQRGRGDRERLAMGKLRSLERTMQQIAEYNRALKEQGRAGASPAAGKGGGS